MNSKEKIYKYLLASALFHALVLSGFYLLTELMPPQRQEPPKITKVFLAPSLGVPHGSPHAAPSLPKPAPKKPELKPVVKKETPPIPVTQAEAPPQIETKIEPPQVVEKKPEPKPEAKIKPKPTPKPEVKVTEKEAPKKKPTPQTKVSPKKVAKKAPVQQPTVQTKRVKKPNEDQLAAALAGIDAEVSERETKIREAVASAGSGTGTEPGPALGSPEGEIKAQNLARLRYARVIKSRIQAQRHRTYAAGDGTRRRAMIFVKVNHLGAVTSKSISKSSGSSSFDRAVLRAIELASPFPPPPPSLKAEVLAEGLVVSISG